MSNTNAFLFQRLFNFIPDIGVKLGNSSYVRKFAQGNNWTRLRIGALVAISNSPNLANIPDTYFYIGVSSSVANPVSSYRLRNFIGARLFPNGTATYAANSGYPGYSGTADVVRVVEDVTSIQVAGATSCLVTSAYTGSRMRRTPIIVDFTRPQGGGGALTVTVYGCSTTTVQVDYRPDHLMQAIDNWGTPVVNGQTLTSWASTSSIYGSETFGKLDQFDLWWNKTYNPLEVYALGGSILLSGYYNDNYGGAYESFGTRSVFSRPAAGSFANGQGTNFRVSGELDGTYTSAIASWIGDGTLIGIGSGTGVYGYYGTCSKFPVEYFNEYSTGTIYSGVLLDKGKWWQSAGTII